MKKGEKIHTVRKNIPITYLLFHPPGVSLASDKDLIWVA